MIYGPRWIVVPFGPTSAQIFFQLNTTQILA